MDPQPHEFAAYLKWDLSEKIDNPLRSYFGLNSLQKEHDFEQHSRLKTSISFDDSEWTVEFGFKECGIAPRDDSGFRLEEVREYLVYVYPGAYDSWSDAAQEARQRVYYRISPRWPDIETKEGIKPMSNPCGIEGFDVEVDGSNFHFSEYPEVLQEALAALSERQGFRFTSYTPICPEDFDPESLHESSNIVDAEYYVRVDKDETGQVYAYDGTLHRISLLLASDRDGYAKTVRDDRECEGYYHTATIGSKRAAALIGGHTLAKEFKHYHMRNPDAVEGTPLENPKVAVAYQNSKNDDTLYWSDLSRLERELDEGLLNLLEWSGIPIRPDHQVFVADDYFEPSGSRRWRKILREQLPRIQDRQEEYVLGATMNAAPTDAEILDQLLTDGGRVSPQDLMESIGCHIDTVYTALKRLSSIVEHNYGEVKLRSKYIAQEIVGRIESVRDGLATDFEGALGDLVRAETYEGREDPFVEWLNDWGGRIQERADERDLLDVGFEFGSRRSAIEVLRSGALKWAEASGKKLYRFGNQYDARFRVKGEGAKYVESVEMLLGGKVHFATA
ncbi:AsnC family protein [Salinigranum rubrum]|uniref:AsnC family protein n=1 Tax=Salinigranum rubrum TaxID=755307 RepID=A0A2I8VH17_9EURY|nr:AsnC family protein [Salinigranum rubrum]AUV81218.1 AsnC family protein [Salinigranum rubrum]